MSDLQQYDESSVTVLKGLEPVKQRPGMYTRTDNPTHICQEVIDNAADEALGGYADTISVAIHSDGSMSISDNGRRQGCPPVGGGGRCARARHGGVRRRARAGRADRDGQLPGREDRADPVLHGL